MLIETLISSIVITSIPFGGIIDGYKCGDIAGRYNFVTKIVYLCDGVPGDMQFYKYHEVGHYFYFNILNNVQKEQYHREYEKAKKQGIGSFLREYGMNSEQEDFADNFVLMVIKNRQPYKVQKRINLIRTYTLKN